MRRVLIALLVFVLLLVSFFVFLLVRYNFFLAPLTEELEYVQQSSEVFDLGVGIKFYGTDFYVVEKQGVKIGFDPFFSHQNALPLLFNADVEYDSVKQKRYKNDFETLSHLFVSHAHFDHCLDLPYVQQQSANAQVFGSKTLKYLFNPYAFEVSEVKENVWYNFDGFKMMAFLEEHPPHLVNHQFYSGELKQPFDEPSRKVNDFLCGQAYSFYIIFDDSTSLFFRDYTNQKSKVQIPQIVEQKGADILLTGFGQKPRSSKNISELINMTRAKVAFLGHWNCFVTKQDNVFIPGSDTKEKCAYIKEHLLQEQTKVIIPRMEGVYHF